MTLPTLRDYQQKLVGQIYRALRDVDRVLLQLATGGGKTRTAGKIVKDAIDRGLSVLWIAHREELLFQAQADLEQWGVGSGLIKSGYPVSPIFRCQVASLQTLVNRDLPPADLVVVDEAHHATSRSYLEILESYSRSKILGLTATPCRLDGTGLNIVFDRLVCGPSMRWLISQGYLCPYKFYSGGKQIDLSRIDVVAGDYSIAKLAAAANKRHLIGDLVDCWMKHANNKRTVIFAVNVEHSQKIVDRYSQAGVKAAHLDGNSSTEERRSTLEKFKQGRIKVLSNCDLFVEGFDVPAIEVVQLARPTQSTALALQMVGRGLRTAPRKRQAVILDHAGIIADHGLPDAPRYWTLEGGLPREAKNEKQCKKCQKVVPIAVKTCPHCGCKFGGREQLITAVAAELEEVEDWNQETEEAIDWLQPEEAIEFPVDHKGQYLLFV